jgi:hypothetical protein
MMTTYIILLLKAGVYTENLHRRHLFKDYVYNFPNLRKINLVYLSHYIAGVEPSTIEISEFTVSSKKIPSFHLIKSIIGRIRWLQYNDDGDEAS